LTAFEVAAQVCRDPVPLIRFEHDCGSFCEYESIRVGFTNYINGRMAEEPSAVTVCIALAVSVARDFNTGHSSDHRDRRRGPLLGRISRHADLVLLRTSQLSKVHRLIVGSR